MVDFTRFDWVILIGTALVAWLLATCFSGSRSSWRGYWLANANLPGTNVAATYFGANLTFTAIFLILSDEAYRRGYVTLCIPVFWCVGSFLFVGLYSRISPALAEGKTLHQALCDAYASRQLQLWASLWTILAFVGTVGLEFYGGILLLKWTGLTVFTSSVIGLGLAFICCAFTISGGFRGVAAADIFLDVCMFAACAVLLTRAVSSSQPVPANPTLLPSPSPADNIIFVIGMAIIFLPFQFCVLDSWQRCAAWRKRDTSPAKWLIPGAILLAACYCVPIWIGITLRHHGVALTQGAHPLLLFLTSHALYTPLLGLVFAGFLSAIFSTADELLNCAALTLVFDVMGVSREQQSAPSITQRRIVASGQFYTSVFSIIAAFFAIAALKYEKPISELALAVFSGQVVFAVPLFISFFAPNWAKRSAPAAALGMALSFVTAIALVVVSWATHERAYADGAPVASFAVSVLTFSVLALYRLGYAMVASVTRWATRIVARIRSRGK